MRSLDARTAASDPRSPQTSGRCPPARSRQCGVLLRLLVPVRVRLVELALGVVLLVHLARVVRAVLGLALKAAVVLLLDHAALHVLLRTKAALGDHADHPVLLRAVRLADERARVPVSPGALLVRDRLPLVAVRARVLLDEAASREESKHKHRRRCRYPSRVGRAT